MVERSVPRSVTERADRALVALATSQHGVVHLDQLRALGVSARVASKRIRSGRLHRAHLAVLSVVPLALLTTHGRWMAAVLACGPDALLSHRSAAALYRLRATARSRIEVLVPYRQHPSHPGIQVHRARDLHPADMARIDGIPCTSVARTVLDLAAVLPLRAMERVLNEAEVLEMFDLTALLEQLELHPHHPGASRLAAALAALHGGPTVTFNEFEEALLSIVDEAGLPRPTTQGWLVLSDDPTPIRPDFLWPTHMLVVETDGWETHKTRTAFEDNRRKDQRLALHGYRSIRLTWHHVHDERSRIKALLSRLLSTAPPPRLPPPSPAAPG